MCCVAEIACLIFGIIALVKGEFKLTRNRVVRSGPARVVGALLLLPVLLGYGGGTLYIVAVGGKMGVDAAKQGKQFNPEDLKKELETPVLVINIVGSAVPLVVAVCVAVATAAPPRRPARHDEDEDDRPRRRRPRDDEDDEEEDDDRPRRRRPRDDDDEDDEHIKER